MRPVSKNRKKKVSKQDSFHLSLDINQFELALINRALLGKPPSILQRMAKSKRILKIQKKNLESLCAALDRSIDEDYLDEELNRLLGRGSFVSQLLLFEDDQSLM
ncbi:hypothetical protein HY990_01085 [Candidatus Micrarchaeota archaeon]|nr:hypothetical protein [Candidatus Micrarchaeota archaeon]